MSTSSRPDAGDRTADTDLEFVVADPTGFESVIHRGEASACLGRWQVDQPGDGVSVEWLLVVGDDARHWVCVRAAWPSAAAYHQALTQSLVVGDYQVFDDQAAYLWLKRTGLPIPDKLKHCRELCSIKTHLKGRAGVRPSSDPCLPSVTAPTRNGPQRGAAGDKTRRVALATNDIPEAIDSEMRPQRSDGRLVTVDRMKRILDALKQGSCTGEVLAGRTPFKWNSYFSTDLAALVSDGFVANTSDKGYDLTIKGSRWHPPHT